MQRWYCFNANYFQNLKNQTSYGFLQSLHRDGTKQVSHKLVTHRDGTINGRTGPFQGDFPVPKKIVSELKALDLAQVSLTELTQRWYKRNRTNPMQGSFTASKLCSLWVFVYILFPKRIIKYWQSCYWGTLWVWLKLTFATTLQSIRVSESDTSSL